MVERKSEDTACLLGVIAGYETGTMRPTTKTLCAFKHLFAIGATALGLGLFGYFLYVAIKPWLPKNAHRLSLPGMKPIIIWKTCIFAILIVYILANISLGLDQHIRRSIQGTY